MNSERVQTWFLHPPSAAFLCQVCHEVLSYPVISINCGHTFCRPCVEKPAAMDTPLHCPADGAPLTKDKIISNLALSVQINELFIACRFAQLDSTSTIDAPTSQSLAPRKELFSAAGSSIGFLSGAGCQTELRLGQRTDHESTCSFAPIECPNSVKCGGIPRAQLAEHMEKCQYYPCPSQTAGCTFFGTQASVVEHVLTCVFAQTLSMQHTAILNTLRGQYESIVSLAQTMEGRLADLEAKQQTLLASQHAQSNKALSSNMQGTQAQVGLFQQPHECLESGELVMPFKFHCIGTFSAHTGPVWQIVAKDNLMLTTGSNDEINVWDLSVPARIGVLSGHEGIVHALCVHNDTLFSGDSEGCVYVWSIRNMEKVRSFQACDDIVSALACSDRFLFVASFGSIAVWNRSTYERVRTLSGLQHWVRSIEYDFAHSLLFGASHTTVSIWDGKSLDLVRAIKTTHGSVHSLALNQKYLVIGTYNRNIHIYDRNTFEHVQELKGHTGTVHSMTMSTRGNFLFSASLDSSVNIWNLNNFLLAQTLNRHDASVNVVLWHQGLLLSGSADKTVKVYKPYKGQVMEVEKERRVKPLVDHQACWGGANLPLRVMPTGDGISVGQGSLTNSPAVERRPVKADPIVPRKSTLPNESNL